MSDSKRDEPRNLMDELAELDKLDRLDALDTDRDQRDDAFLLRPDGENEHVPLGFTPKDWDALVLTIANEATPEERAYIEHRLATDPEFAKLAEPVFEAWAIPLSPTSFDLDAGWTRLKETVGGSPHNSNLTPLPQLPWRTRFFGKRHPIRVAIVAAAAYMVIFLIYTLYTNKQYSGIHYRSGSTAMVALLPDSSVVTLAPHSFLGTEGSFLRGTRTVYLLGQAKFKVRPDPARPFIVRVTGVRATALGTTFSLHADSTPHIDVAVQTGRVALEIFDSHGHPRTVSVLAAGEASNIPVLVEWFTQSGGIAARAGVSGEENDRIHDAMMRAAARLAAIQNTTRPSP